MQALQAELDTIEVEGTSGGGMVSVRLTAKGDLKGVSFDDSLMKPTEKEILEDLLVAAHADARPQGRGRDAGKDEGLDRRPAAAAGDEPHLNAHRRRRTRNRAPIQLLAKLPGLGPRSARRAALHLIKKREMLMAPLTGALQTRWTRSSSARPAQYRHQGPVHGLH